MRRLLLALAGGLGVLASVVFLKTALFASKQVAVEPAAETAVQEEQAAAHLAQALRFQTVSHQDPAQFPAQEFQAFHRFLEQAFPKVHSELERQGVSEYSLLYTWKGQQERLKPVLWMGHQDVVPVEPGTESAWTYPPFEGRIAENYIWGRGAMDDKSAVVAMLEAIETLRGQGFQPQRTLYLALGHDEEQGGRNGALKIASLLGSRGTRLEYVLDEGGFVAGGMVPGLVLPVALVGIAEKGYLSLELVVESSGGHSSMPPPQTAVGILSAAIHKLENPWPARLSGASQQMWEYLGPEMRFWQKMVFANQWFFGRFLLRELAANPTTNAQIRTTAAATVFQAGVKENVLPTQAKAVINFRILPGDSVQSVIEYARQTIADRRVQVQVLGGILSEPSPISSVESPHFTVVEKTIRQVFPGTLVAPYLVVGGTDSRHYAELSPDIYRFNPLPMRPQDVARLHGINERVSVEGFTQAVRFYAQLLRNSLQ